MKLEFLIFSFTVTLIATRVFLGVTAIDCYAYQTGISDAARIETGCAECRKVYMRFNSSGKTEVSESWQCETSFKGSLCPVQESVATSYFADDSSETRLCICCTDYCNGALGFCNDNNSIVKRIKAMIAPPKTKKKNLTTKTPMDNLLDSSPPGLTCYNSTNITLSKIEKGCKQCRKTSFESRHLGSIVNSEHRWDCVTNDDIVAGGATSTKPCTPFVSATVSTDGMSSVQAYCTCCSDECNTPTFCRFLPPTVSLASSASVNTYTKRNIFPVFATNAVLCTYFLSLVTSK